MCRLLLIGLLVLTGCQSVVGPLQRGWVTDPVDQPCLSPDEQKMRVRDRLALPDASPEIGPRTYADNPALRGR